MIEECRLTEVITTTKKSNQHKGYERIEEFPILVEPHSDGDSSPGRTAKSDPSNKERKRKK